MNFTLVYLRYKNISHVLINQLPRVMSMSSKKECHQNTGTLNTYDIMQKSRCWVHQILPQYRHRDMVTSQQLSTYQSWHPQPTYNILNGGTTM